MAINRYGGVPGQFAWKNAVRVATTAAGTLATDFEAGDIHDGITLVAGDGILLKDQVSQDENGIYTVQATGAPVRRLDANTPVDINGATVFVKEGTANANTAWFQNQIITTIDVDNIIFVQAFGAGLYLAGAGLALTGNTFSVKIDTTTDGYATISTGVNGTRVISIKNANIAADAAIARSKVAAGTADHVVINDGSGVLSSEAQLALSRGGTNAALTASDGGIVYSTATALAVLAGVAQANRVLLSGLSAAPAWSTAVYPATTTINQLLYSSAADTITGLATAANGILVTSGAGVPSIGTAIPSGVTAGGTFSPTVSDGAALGTGTAMWSDIFLASGGVINFNNGNITIAHSTNAITWTGAGWSETKTNTSAPASTRTVSMTIANADGSYLFRDQAGNTLYRAYQQGTGLTASHTGLEIANASTSTTASITKTGTSITSTGAWSGASAINRALYVNATGGTTNYSIVAAGGAIVPETNDGIALGSTTLAFADLFLATGGVLNFGSGNGTITHSTGQFSVNVTTVFGAATARAQDGVTPVIQTDGIGYDSGAMRLGMNNATASTRSLLQFVRSKGATAGSTTAVASGDNLGGILWYGYDGTNAINAGGIEMAVDGTVGVNDMPGRLVFFTTPDGSSTTAERMRIDSAGLVGIGLASLTTNARLHANGVATYRGANVGGLFSSNSNGTAGGIAIEAGTGQAAASSQAILLAAVNNSLAVYGATGTGNFGSVLFSLTNAGELKIETAGKGVSIKEGANARQGTATLVAGTVTVSTTAVTATSRVYLTSQVDGGTPGFLRVTTITAGTSFVITSSNGADTSTVAWLIMESF